MARDTIPPPLAMAKETQDVLDTQVASRTKHRKLVLKLGEIFS